MAESPSNNIKPINIPISKIPIPDQKLIQISQQSPFARFSSHNTQFPQSKIKRIRSSKKQFTTPPIQAQIPTKVNLSQTRACTGRFGAVDGYAANSHKGLIRTYNQDRVSVCLNFSKSDTPCSYFAIFDGHGGSACAQYLTNRLHQLIIQNPILLQNPIQALNEGFQQAERQFLAQARRLEDYSGSCAIVVLFVGDQCYVANTGDSRAVLSAKGGKEVIALSKDHKPDDPREASRINKAGGYYYFSGAISKTYSRQVQGCYRVSPGNLAISRTFGDLRAKDPKFGGKSGVVIARPDIRQLSIQRQHDFIVMASDGIFDELSCEEVVKAVWDVTKRKVVNPLKTAQLGVENIIQEAFRKLTSDNVTVVVICLKGFSLQMSKRLLKDPEIINSM